jgi:hypothetical protein
MAQASRKPPVALLFGRLPPVDPEVRKKLERGGISFVRATDRVQIGAIETQPIDGAIIGAAINLNQRLEIVGRMSKGSDHATLRRTEKAPRPWGVGPLPQTLMLAVAAAFGGLFVLSESSVMAQPILPTEIGCYFNTVQSENALAFGSCFSDGAEVVDVNRPIRGRSDIVRWANNEVMGGRYTLHEFSSTASGGEVLLTFVPPGATSGFRARYLITTKDGKIHRMVLRYA